MLGILGTGVVFILTVIFSLSKASSKRERLAEQHRQELLARKNNIKKVFVEKNGEKNEDKPGFSNSN